MPVLNRLDKDKVVNHHQDVPFRVLDRRYSFGAGSDNTLIHGDDLNALKALLPQYEGRVTCVYIMGADMSAASKLPFEQEKRVWQYQSI